MQECHDMDTTGMVVVRDGGVGVGGDVDADGGGGRWCGW